MDFEEWFESRDDIGCLIGLEGYAAEEAWNARQAEIDALKAELAKYQREGYKLVPVEPTKAMQQSAFDVYEVCDYKNYHLNSGTEVRDMIYKAMIGAAE